MAELPTQSKYRWFTPLWAGAILFHLAGNSGHIRAWTTAGILEVGMALLAISLVLRPSSARLAAMAAIHLPIVALKAPVVGNHEMIEALIHLAILASMLARGREWRRAFVPGARAILIVSYGFIVFSKLNVDFLDPAVSCAVVFGDELGRHFGVSVGDFSVLSYAVIGGTLLGELAVPVALVTRLRYAVPFAIAFHFILAFDPSNHVYDFSSTLLPLFLLFLPADFGPFASNRLSRFSDGVRLQVIFGAVVVGEVIVLLSDVRIWLIAYPAWWIVGGGAWWLALSYCRQQEDAEKTPHFAPLHPFVAGAVLLAVLNGVAPYLELKTASGFNMYSNLLTAQGETNHLLLPGTLALSDTQEHLVEIVASSAPTLSRYQEQGLLIPVTSFQTYLRDYPDTSALIEIDGRRLQVSPGETLPELAGGPGWFEAKFGHFRALDLDGPKSCLRGWGASH